MSDHRQKDSLRGVGPLRMALSVGEDELYQVPIGEPVALTQWERRRDLNDGPRVVAVPALVR